MNRAPLESERLELFALALDEVRARVAGMDDCQRAFLSPEWLARLQNPTADDLVWSLGFKIVHRTTKAVVGQCGFKGPPGTDRTVEIAYQVEPEHQNRGFATEAAGALVAFAFGSGKVHSVRAHTLPERNASARVLSKCGFRFLGEVIEPEDGLVWRWEKRNEAVGTDARSSA